MSRNRSNRPRPRLEALEPRCLMTLAGSLDPAFGGGAGYVSVPIPSATTTGLSNLLEESSIASLPDGKILLAGGQASDAPGAPTGFVIARLDADGTLDPTFGTGGVFRYALPSGNLSQFDPMVVQADGKIIAVGTTNTFTSSPGDPTTHVVAIRVDADGTLDPTYGQDGLAEFTFPPVGTSSVPTQASIAAITLQADGKLVIGGNVAPNEGPPTGPDSQFALARLDVDGELDTSFGVAGTVEAPVQALGMTEDQAFGLAIEPSGRIVVAGSASDGTFSIGPTAGSNVIVALPTTEAVAAGFTPAGVLDPTFGDRTTPGVIFIPAVPTSPATPGFAAFRSIVALPDGELLAAETDAPIAGGAVGPTADSVLGLEADGSGDPDFGQDSRATIPGLSTYLLGPLAVQADGKIVVAGDAPASGTNTTGSFLATRLDADGTVDPTFRFASPTFPGFDLSGTSLAISPAGRILLAGSIQVEGGAPARDSFVVASLLPGSSTSTPTPTPTPTPTASADLAVAAEAPTPALPGSPESFRFLVTNDGPSPADALLAVQFTVSGGGPARTGVALSQGTVMALPAFVNGYGGDLGTLAPGASAMITAVIIAPASGVIEAAAFAYSAAVTDPAPANNLAYAGVQVTPIDLVAGGLAVPSSGPIAALEVDFFIPLNASAAQDVANYRVVTGSTALVVRSATYDPSTGVVKLGLARSLARSKTPIEVTISDLPAIIPKPITQATITLKIPRS